MTYTADYDRIPEPDRKLPRKSALGRVIGWLLAWAIILGGAGFAAGSWGWLKFVAPGPSQKAQVVQIEKGLNRSEIADLLQKHGVIEDANVFGVAAAVNTLRGRYLIPGEYEFQAASTMQEVMNQLLAGRVVTYKLTIPEGWTTEMALARIRENDVLTGEIAAAPAEGTLVADTQVFPRGKTRQQVINDMIAAQTKLVDEIWARRPAASPLRSREQLVTLASIVEKETGKAEERPLVAAVFLNRLKNGMKLQSDPTIIYGIVGGKGKLDRPLTRADIDTPTPYNTYAIDGLPPGPIASPGRASLEAVINPAPVPYLYFVADGTGGHAFATTLDEHNANVSKWRKLEDQDAPGPDDTARKDAEGVLAQVPLEPAVPALEPVAPATAAAAAAAAPTESAAAPLETATAALPAASTAKTADGAEAGSAGVAENEPVLDLKPGSVIRVGAKLIPVPAERRPKL